MPSDTENYLRVLQVQMDALGLSLENALEHVPERLRTEVRRLHEERRPSEIAHPAILASDATVDWWASIAESDHYHWPRLRKWLVDVKGRHPDAVRNLDLESTRVVRLLGDPRAPPVGAETYRVQGLVVGYVQSGKTANFTATIAKAADAGYLLVIVLAGIHNTLRRQTQQRLELELGLRPDRNGVPAPDPEKGWFTLTKPDLSGDFRPGTMSDKILHAKHPILAVVKKNGAVLRRLLRWIGDTPPAGLPVLIVDDEADQASVNTGGNQPEEASDEDERPSTINRLIRDLIRRFKRVSYVAYTATPFANVFIDHQGMDRAVMQDLYPKDFIVALDKPHGYVGAEDMFGRPALRDDEEKPPLDLTVAVDDADVGQVVPPPKRRKTQDDDEPRFQATLPASLEDALEEFVLLGAGFLARKPEKDRQATPLTMLVHSHHTIDIHRQLGALVTKYIEDLRRDWRYDRDRRLLRAFRTRWEDKITPVTARIDASKVLTFTTVEPLVGEFLRELRVLTINSESDDVLDYEREPGLKSIVVGGNRLSRGVTLENLLVSYFLRESEVLDTLLQMGRWFGHRREYVDLTRLYTTSTLIEWFQEIAAAEEELRDDIRLYAASGRTPMDFGPRVRCHPALSPTAKNKMQHAQSVSSSFAGHLKQTILFRLDDEDFRWLTDNLEATRDLIRGLGKPSDVGELLWRGVPVEAVLDFFRRYRTHTGAGSVDAESIRQYISAQVAEKELLHWDVLLRENAESSSQLGQESLGIVGGRKVNRIARSRLKDTQSIGILINPAEKDTRTGDECTGLTDDQISEASRLLTRDPKLKWGRALRRVRDKERGLLILYPISPASEPRELGSRNNDEKRDDRRVALFPPERRAAAPTVVGVAVVFPDSDSFATTEYMVGTAGAYGQA